MRVKAKEGKTGFIYGSYRTEEEEFELVEVTTASGETIPVEDQYSEIWMDKVRGRPGRKPKETTG